MKNVEFVRDKLKMSKANDNDGGENATISDVQLIGQRLVLTFTLLHTSNMSRIP